MKRHAALLTVILFAACGEGTMNVGSQGGGGEGGVGIPNLGGSIGGELGGSPSTRGGAGPTGTGAGPAMGLGGALGSGASPSPTSGGSPSPASGGTPGVAGTNWSVVGGVGGEFGVLEFAPIVPASCGVGNLRGQVWEGFTEDAPLFPTQEWRLELILADDGRLCGSATHVAEGQMPLGVATDPDAAYPPGITEKEWSQPSTESWPGVTYSIVEGYQRGGTWEVDLAASELWSDWCRIQQPYAGNNGYSCLPEDIMFMQDGQYYYVDSMLKEHAFSPMKKHLCRDRICSCTSKDCSIAMASPIEFHLNQTSDTELTGALVNGNFVVGITLTLDVTR